MKNIFIILTLLFSSIMVSSKELPELNRTVVDPYGYISQEDKNKIDEIIRDYLQKTKVQIGVVVIDSLDGENIESYAVRIFDKWKLGSEKEDDGLLFLYVIKDRAMRTEVGRGLEGFMTDVESKRIQGMIKSELRNAEYGKAVINQLTLTIHEIEYNRKSYEDDKKSPKVVSAPTPEMSSEDILEIVGILLIVLSLLIFMRTVKKIKSIEDKKQEIPTLQLATKNLGDFLKSYKTLIVKTKELVKEIQKKYETSFLKEVLTVEKEIEQYDSWIDGKEKEIMNVKTIVRKYKKEGQP